MNLLEQQKKLEKLMFDGGIERWNEQNASKQDKSAGSTDWNNRLAKVFIEPLAIAIEDELRVYSSSLRKNPVAIDYLLQADVYEVAFITIRVTLNEVTSRESTSMAWLQDKIASNIEDQVRFGSVGRDKSKKSYINKVQESLKRARSADYKHKKNTLAAASNTLGDDWISWPQKALTHVGSYLLKMLIKHVVDYAEDGDDFFELHMFETKVVNMGTGETHKTVRTIGVTDMYADFVSTFVADHQGLYPEVMPCVVKPRDWVSPFIGGYHTPQMAARCPMVKTDKEHAKLLTKKQMPSVYEAVNWLQQVRWKINTDILDIAQEIRALENHHAKPAILELEPPVNPIIDRLNEVQEKAEANRMTKELQDRYLTEQERLLFREWKYAKRQWHEAANEAKAKLLSFGRVIDMAERYSIYEELYFVWFLDYRQRYYTYSTGLGPQAGDIPKALLRFADERKLGKGGVSWFKLHGSGLYGNDKKGIDERLAAADSPEFIDMTKRVAADPVGCLDWLSVGKKKAWQFLAWVLEYNKLLTWVEEGNKEEDFVTFISCQQDGSCSGLQHYSAMLRDEAGGEAVNLTDSDIPQDVYDRAAQLVIRDLELDAKSDDEELARLAQMILSIGIDRGLAKVPTMTLCYASTQMTCRNAVSDFFDERKHKLALEGYELPFKDDPERWAAESYVSAILWTRIGDVVIKAKEGMAFYKAIAKAYSKANQPMYITAPTGFIMKQTAWKCDDYTIDTMLHGRMQFKVYTNTDKIDARKMTTMAAPNGIHLCDSTHVTFTVCESKKLGISSLWVVHDDFGTHGGYTAHLHKGLRYTMWDMYQANILEGILEEARARLGDKAVSKIKVPEYGDLDIDEILHSKYAFL